MRAYSTIFHNFFVFNRKLSEQFCASARRRRLYYRGYRSLGAWDVALPPLGAPVNRDGNEFRELR